MNKRCLVLLKKKIMDGIEIQVKAILAAKLGVSIKALRENASFTYDFGADSLNMLEAIMDIERQFHISIPDVDVEKLRTVDQLIHYVKQHVKQQRING